MPLSSLRTALTIALASSPAFANRRTLVITLLAAPVLSTLMLAAVIGSIPGTDLRGAVYAGILLSAFTSVMSATNATLAYERHTGVVPAALFPRFGTPAYWVAKPVLPLISAALISLMSLGAVFFMDPARDTHILARALVVLPVALVCGAIIGLAVGVFSLILSDPYLVSNVLSGVLPLTAGVAAPLAAYPDWLRAISQLLPMSWTVDAMRTGGSPLPGELWTTVPWVVLGFAGVVLARRRLRDGRDASLF
ncbi:MAG: hypothetical protein DI613_15440 [Kocuria rhizophila]|nr:MAG: hypothetical protein DI613_15440 [Kocuria rhizophila]